MSSRKVFYLCEHTTSKNPKRKAIIGIISFILGPIMPAIILANYIFYREQEYDLKRELQSHGSLEFDLGNDEQEEAIAIHEENQKDKDSDTKKVSLFRRIQKLRYRSALNRRYYSYYR